MESAAPNLVFVDRGGPGVDIIADGPSIVDTLPLALRSSWIALLVEPWVLDSPPDGCLLSSNIYVSEVRQRLKNPGSSPADVAHDCQLEDIATDSERVGRELRGLSNVLDATDLGAVGASFGAARIGRLIESGFEFDAVLVDSPVLAPSGHIFVNDLARSVSAHTADLVGDGWRGQDLLETLSVYGSSFSTDFTPLDSYLALYAVSLNPDSNGKWVERVFVRHEVSQEDASSIRALADAILRHDGFDVYNESWRGHLADVCAYIDFGSPGTVDRSDLESEFSEHQQIYADYFSAIYAPCVHVEARQRVTGSLEIFPCIVNRPDDPVAPWPDLLKSDQFTIDGQRGHTPLSPSAQLDDLISKFWSVCA